MFRRHFFLVGAVIAVAAMILLGGAKLLLGKGSQGNGGGGNAAPAAAPAAGGAQRGGAQAVAAGGGAGNGGGNAAGGRGGAGGRGARTMVQAASIGSRSFADRIDVIGVAKGRQSVTITSSAAQLITDVKFRDGQKVARGQVLVELKSTEQDAGVDQARSAVDIARINYERWNTLAQKGIAAPATAESYKASYDQAKANLAAAEARLGDRVIRAPFSGVMGLTDVAPGTLISPGSAIATLDDVSVVRVDFNVPDRYLLTLKEGTPIVARSDSYPGKDFDGVIAKLDTRIDEKTRAIRARAELPNPQNLLRPGMLIHIGVQQAVRTALSAPEAAVQFDSDQAYVYAIVQDGQRVTVDRRPVETGVRDGGFVEIKSGLNAGDRVVADGINRLQNGQAVQLAAGAGGGRGGAGGRGGRGGGDAAGAAAPAPAGEAGAKASGGEGRRGGQGGGPGGQGRRGGKGTQGAAA